MHNTAESTNDTEHDVDWPALLRLALIASVVAAVAAVALTGHLAETTIVVCVIVAATMASWFQIEHQRPSPRRIPVRRD